jgi:pectate lyase
MCPPRLLVGYASVQVPDGDGGLGPATIGGEGGPVMPASDESTIEALGKMPGPVIIQIQGMVTVNGQADIVAGFKTIEAAGPGSGLMGGGLRVKSASNVIVRNLTVVNAYNTDSITLDGADHVWVDHCDLYSQPVSSTDTFDDLIDIIHASDYVTVSWTKLHDHAHDVSFVGNSDSATDDIGKLHVTFHHNLFKHTLSHNPSLRFGTLHVYSNHYVDIADVGVLSRMNGMALVEENVFDNVGRPLLTHFPDSPTDGFMENVGNLFPNSTVPTMLQSMDLTVPYRYTFTEASAVPDVVDRCVGPIFP